MKKTTIVSIDVDRDTENIHVIQGGSVEAHADYVAEKTEEILKSGQTIHLDNGDRVYRERVEDMENGRLVWHEDGNRHRCTWYEITETPVEDGFESKRRKLRTVWVNPQ